MSEPSAPDDPLAALKQAAQQALTGRPTPPSRTQFVRLCVPQIERCIELGWSAADFASVLSEYMQMTARQFTEALRGARTTSGQWGRRSGSAGAAKTQKPGAPMKSAPEALKTKGERDEYAREVIPDEPMNPRLERLMRKRKGEES